jgi:hypothetical protein
MLNLRLIIFLISIPYLGCSVSEKKDDAIVIPEVTIVALSNPSIGDDPIIDGDDEIEPVDLLGGAVTTWTTMTGQAKTLGGRVAVAGIIQGNLIGLKGDADDRDDICALVDTLPFSTVIVPGPEDAKHSKKLKKKLLKFGYDSEGKAKFLKGSGEAGKKHLRFVALGDQESLGDLDRFGREIWLVGVLNRPWKKSDKFPKDFNLVIAPGTTNKITTIDQGIFMIVQLPSLQLKPYQFFTFTLSEKGAEVVAWPAQMSSDGKAPQALQRVLIELK